MPIRLSRRAFVASVLALSAATPVLAEQDPRPYTLATASEGGTYYPVGVAMALLAKINLQGSTGIDMEAITSAGSIENIALMREGTAQFGILQVLAGDLAQQATDQTVDFGPQDELRAVAMLWPDVAHFLLRSDLALTGTLDDLANLTGQGFSMGAEGSGTAYANGVLFANYGLDTTDWGVVNADYVQSVQMLVDGQIGGVNISSGIGAASVVDVFTRMNYGVRLLSVTNEQAASLDGGMGALSTVTIPAGTYPGLQEPLQSASMPNFLAVRGDVPDEDVYQITRVIFENLEYLCGVQAAACGMSLEAARTGLPIALHPGAARYFDEVGVLDPSVVAAETPEE